MKIKKKSVIRKISRWHAIFTLILLIAYITAGSVINPAFLVSDIKYKSAWAASSVDLAQRIFSIPNKPEFSVQTGCSGANAHIILNWNDDENATAFDVYRDGLELITDLNASNYTDNNVEIETAYEYYVAARGPAGENTSDTLEATSVFCEEELPEPVVEITTFQNKSATGIPKTSDRTPTFSGTSNIANAIVNINISSDFIVSAQAVANANGYWSWTCPVKLSQDTHTIYITLIDPDNNSRTAADSFSFKVKEDDSDENDDDEDDDSQEVETETETAEILKEKISKKSELEKIDVAFIQDSQLFKMDFTIENKEFFIFHPLKAQIRFYDLKEEVKNKNITITYLITDTDGNTLNSMSETKKFIQEENFQKEIPLLELKHGKYKLQIEVRYENFSLSSDKEFFIKESPVIYLGGFSVALSQIISNLGWLLLTAVILLFFYLFLLTAEYIVSKTVLIQITERELFNRGLISRRRGVQK